MKITLLVSDMSTNCLGRAHMLGQVLSKHYNVDIIGPMFGHEIWAPIDKDELDYQAIPAGNFPSFVKSAASILEQIDGDVVYAFKPLLTSFGLSLIARSRLQRPIVLDIDDWEIGFARWNLSHQTLRTLISIYSPSWFWWTLLLDKLTCLADVITVSCHFLSERYGGYLIPHARDVRFLDPAKYDSAHLRNKLRLCGKKIVLFLGTPRSHKGIEDLIEAVQLIRNKDINILLVGADSGNPYVQHLIEKANGVLNVVGTRPLSERPYWLSVADMVVLPQRLSSATKGQVPAKLFDAMAMAKPIVASAVSDIPQILEGCGIVVPPNDPKTLADGIGYLIANPDKAAELGAAARRVCAQRYSLEVIESTLLDIFSKFE
jgi:glycosyltransferase involved in cell wall biosynthesis